MRADRKRAWLVNLERNPRMTFHIKRGSQADVPATARIVEDPEERRTVMRHIIDTAWHNQDLEAMVALKIGRGNVFMPGLRADTIPIEIRRQCRV